MVEAMNTTYGDPPSKDASSSCLTPLSPRCPAFGWRGARKYERPFSFSLHRTLQRTNENYVSFSYPVVHVINIAIMAAILQPFQLLELNLISAQDLVNVNRKMRTYAVAWIKPDRKLTTRVDAEGHANPTWNDKFVFRVDDDFLHGDTSAIMIEIYACHWFRDILVGIVRALVGNLIPPSNSMHDHHHHHHLQLGMRFVALQVRRPSGRPQGILNIGVAILDSSKRSLPLYTLNSSSAVGYRHLMGQEQSSKDDDAKSKENQNPLENFGHLKPKLRRTKSDSSSMLGSVVQNTKTSSAINNGREAENKNTGQATKEESRASSCITTSKKQNKKKGKASSLVNGLEFGGLTRAKYGSEVTDGQATKTTPSRNSSPAVAPSDLEKLTSRFDELDLRAPHGAPKKKNAARSSIAMESDFGPSPSEVAAALGKKRRYRVEDTGSEVLGDHSLELESSMGGLQSKLERWRAEIPNLHYDLSDLSSFLGHRSFANSGSTPGKTRRRTASDSDRDGTFSCFGSICGMECSIVCGGSSTRKKKKGSRSKRSWSVDNLSFL